MSLQVWLPLNGSLENKGLTSATFTNTGATVSTDGKIGSCYSFDGTDDSISVPFNDVITDEFTVSMWFYKSEWGSKSYETLFGGPSGFEIESKYSSTNEPYVRAHNWGSAMIPYSLSVWNHLVVTRTSSETKWYLNGELKATGTAGSLPSGDYFIGAWKTSSQQNFKGKINDFRLYDHCLSTTEVKELSKGLVLHYPMNDPYIESTTNIGGTSVNYSNMTYGYEYAASSWGGDAGTVTFYSSGGYNNYPYKVYHKTATGSGGIYKKTNNDITLVSGKTYTMSVYVKASIAFTDSSYNFNINGKTSSSTNQYITYGKSVSFTTDWQRLEKTFTVDDSLAGTYGEMNIIYYDGVTDFYVYYSGFQIEEKDHATPFVVGSRALTTVYDCSGYGNDGTINGTITCSSDTPRYSNCVNIPSSANITHPRCMLEGTTQEWTCCAWVKPTTLGYLNNFNNGNNMKNGTYPLLYLNSGTNDYYVYGNKAMTTGAWQHIAFVFRNSDGYRKVYINGVDQTDTGPNKTSTPSGIPATVTLFSNYAGLVSDYREYSTALSADYIKDLYNTSTKVAKNGTLLCYEIKEN